MCERAVLSKLAVNCSSVGSYASTSANVIAGVPKERGSAHRQSSPQMGHDIAGWKNLQSSVNSSAGWVMQFPNIARTCYLSELPPQNAPMNLRRRFLTTATLLCHFLALPTLLTSQLRPAEPVQTEEVTIAAAQQEKTGDVYKLSGNVDIVFRDYDIKADEIIYNAATGDITASGHLMFDGGPNDLHMEGSRAVYNVRTEYGKFYDVVGST